uniref:Nucleotid_trans domain-containing protein n=1 Tax=Panagrellus redivivus TaxID=6233 RepID=A0A7E4V689_PANRE
MPNQGYNNKNSFCSVFELIAVFRYVTAPGPYFYGPSILVGPAQGDRVFSACRSLLNLAVFQYLATELERGYYAISDSVLEIDIESTRPKSLDIGILIIVGDDHNDTDYRLALDSTQCYAAMHGYDFKIERITPEWKKRCPETDFMFARHCVASHLLHRHEWTLFLDADVGVINPNRFLDDYINEASNGTDLIFYDRFFCWEIAAGSYFVRNTSFSQQFLMKFAELEGGDLPNSFHGRDNGAIHWLFVREFFPNTSSQVDPSSCMAIWRESTDFVDLFVFEACTRLIFGEVRYFHAAPENGGPGIVELLPKGTGWMRDIWLTQSKVSPDTDFMIHGLKHSIEIPGIDDASAMERARARRKFEMAIDEVAGRAGT